VIILDTNIASVILLPNHPDLARILGWQESSIDKDFRISAITRAEIAYGVAILPDGAKKRQLAVAVNNFLQQVASVTLPFGVKEADAYAAIVAARRSEGHPIGVLDAQIAATAMVAGAQLATRNVRDFDGCDVSVVNPYEP